MRATLARPSRIGKLNFDRHRPFQIEPGTTKMSCGAAGIAVPSLLAVFGENISMFERIWYGVHDVNRELVLQFGGERRQDKDRP